MVPGPSRVADEAFVRRFYEDPRTRVLDGRVVGRMARYVAAALRNFEIPVRSVLDAGCGIGLWRAASRRAWPKASWTGLEASPFLAAKYGWIEADLASFRTRRRWDLVVCQSVLQYLDDDAAEGALENLGRLSRGALYFEVLTRKDWEERCDRGRTDGSVVLRDGGWYRGRLARHFFEVGGGLWISREQPNRLWELEQAPESRPALRVRPDVPP